MRGLPCLISTEGGDLLPIQERPTSIRGPYIPKDGASNSPPKKVHRIRENHGIQPWLVGKRNTHRAGLKVQGNGMKHAKHFTTNHSTRLSWLGEM